MKRGVQQPPELMAIACLDPRLRTNDKVGSFIENALARPDRSCLDKAATAVTMEG